MADGQTKAERNDGRAGDLLGAVVPSRARELPSSPAEADLGNVIFFAPRRSPGARPAPAVSATGDRRPAPRSLAIERHRTWALLVAGSLAFHAGLLAAVLREPSPHASIGLEVISVEITLGARQAAGLAPTPSESETTSAPSPQENKPVAPEPETARKAVEKPAPEIVEPAEQAKPEQPAGTQPLQAEIPPAPQNEPELAVDPRPPEKPTTVAALPARDSEIRETPKPRPEPKPAEKRSRDDGKSRRERAAPASPASVASNSVGRGRSEADTNYRGLVSAHLARHKQFPADARSRGDQGTASVTFSLDGGGRVTSVRLARGSGIASIDQETQAMVRRASPFPPPPSGRAVNFTVPVQFHLR